MAENILTSTEAFDQIDTSDKASTNFQAVLPEADSDFRNFENHITDDVSGTEGKAGTLTHEFNDQTGVLDGSFNGPDRYILTDAGDLDVKHQKTATHYSQTNPHFIVMDEVVKNDPAMAGKFGDGIFNSFLNADASERSITASTVSGLRTALVQAGDTRWTSDAMLGRKDIHGKLVYLDKLEDGNFCLKLNNCMSAAALMTQPNKSQLKIKMTQDNKLM